MKTINAVRVTVVVPVQLDQLMFLSANSLLVILAALTVSVYPGLACRKHVLVQKIITKKTTNALRAMLVGTVQQDLQAVVIAPIMTKLACTRNEQVEIVATVVVVGVKLLRPLRVKWGRRRWGGVVRRQMLMVLG